ncbi:MAG: hypothetical protein A2754_03295 [Candidatus Magasanikbacteria bacterium RIFCSPHIGHO2_01_FULL_47_8]|uniref:Uncharacterized protein n=1 Tax=Candidatus Magasanikbacteria bacterium RIFCSPHIGHO2_01_FULL_47_8 TaxID=1798673 RepID=A0A1F6MAW3_9BACT|nr:MAG: hypothetical protein A2754_03295 [Candidatus Magasanikbacteria bacterium RIFCSPHIGHO2_01_FULL_47_8]
MDIAIAIVANKIAKTLNPNGRKSNIFPPSFYYSAVPEIDGNSMFCLESKGYLFFRLCLAVGAGPFADSVREIGDRTRD